MSSSSAVVEVSQFVIKARYIRYYLGVDQFSHLHHILRNIHIGTTNNTKVRILAPVLELEITILLFQLLRYIPKTAERNFIILSGT